MQSVIQPSATPQRAQNLDLASALSVTYTGATCAGPLARTIDPSTSMLESVIGDVITFAVSFPAATEPRFELARRPPERKPDNVPDDESSPIYQAWAAGQRNAARLDGGRLQCSRQGLYQVRVTLAGWSRLISVACFPVVALDHMQWPPSYRAERRARLRAIVAHHRHGMPSPESVIAALESGGHGITGALLGQPSINVRQFGDGA